MFTVILAIAMVENSISVGYQHVNNIASRFSMNFAEGCFEEAIHRLEIDSSYSGSTLNFTDGSCVITVTGEVTKTIDIILTYLDYIQNFRGTADITTVGLNSYGSNVSLSSFNRVAIPPQVIKDGEIVNKDELKNIIQSLMDTANPQSIKAKKVVCSFSC